MSMSIGMAAGMNALIGINAQLQDLQAQALSGKKVNSASDGLAAYLGAKNYTDRSGRLSNVNDTLAGNLQTIKAAQSGLSSIRKTISDTLDTLKAASQTQSFVAATGQTTNSTASASNTQIGMTFTMFDGNGVQSLAGITNATGLVNPTGAANGASQLRINGQTLAQGQIFSINGKFYRISGTAASDPVPAGTATDGASAATPAYVRTVGELLGAIRGGISGADNSAGIANFNNNRIIANGAGTLSFAQVAGTAVNDLKALFQSGRATPANPANGATTDLQSQGSLVGGYQSFTMSAVDWTVSGGTNGQTADARRAAAAKSYRLAIDQINQYLRNASVSGTNLLNGDILKVTFDEKNTSTNFQIQDSANAAMTFTAASLGLVSSATGASPDLGQNFATNEDAALDAQGNSTVGLNAAINKLTNSLNTINLGDSQIAQFQATTQNRVDFNKSIVSLLDDAANSLTAADMTQVAAQTAALQVQQSFAQTILANTKSSDQSILQLLR
ncbi:MAG: hypothetical protein WCO61_08215 [Alphaproteobacteria bacterium]